MRLQDGSFWPSPDSWRQMLGPHAEEIVADARKCAERGEHMVMDSKKGRPPAAKRYCVICLADGEKTAATHIIDGAGYCLLCLKVAEGNGMGPAQTLDEYQRGASSPMKHRLTPEQRSAIAGENRLIPAKLIARKYGVTGQTVLNIRKEFPVVRSTHDPAEKPASAITIHEPIEVEVPADRPCLANVEVLEQVWEATLPKMEASPEPDNDSEAAEPADSWEVAVQIPKDRAPDIFSKFTIQEQFDAIGYVLQRRIDAIL